MSSHPQPSPPGGMPAHLGPMMGHPQVNGHIPVQKSNGPQIITQMNEQIWIQLGSLAELMGDLDGALQSYEHALRHNQWSVPAMTGIATILRTREQFAKAVEYLQNILKIDANNGEIWGSLGHCHLMMDNLQEAYTSYQQALYYLRDPKEPKLWYGIGILYDRYGSLDHAEEAFSQVMRMQPDFEKANEIYFRLGIIYKQQQKFQQSLECFRYIVHDPPRPLNEEDIWFQIGHVHEQQKDYESAKHAYRRVLERDSKHAKVLQQLGWLHHQQNNEDAQSWYLLGRCYMAQQKFPKAYEAYQQAVYRDGRNPTFWCSIGVLYYQINQYRDALDAYSRAIRLNPYISEVWYDLGTLYESCNNQTNDALDAYTRAAELDPTNIHIKARLQLLRSGQATGPNQHNAPIPQDVHPQAYQNGVGVPPGPQWGAAAPQAAPPQHPQPPQGRVADWTRNIADVSNPPQQPPLAKPYEQRDSMRAPPQRQPSPRQEPPRHYADQARHTPARKPMSPSPKMNSAVPSMYPPGPHTLPQLNGPDRNNQNYGPGVRPQPQPNGTPINGSHTLLPQGPLPPYGRPFSPPNELRPLRDERPPSPGPGYHHQPPQPHQQPYNHSQPFPGASSMAAGAPAPPAAHPMPDGMPRDAHDRPPSAMKRHREWESESGPSKKVANDETRARLDEHASRRASPPGRVPTPRDAHRRSSSEIRKENQRIADQNYHPSEAAHHPAPLAPPPSQMQPQHAIQQSPHTPLSQHPQHIPSMNTMYDAAKEERKEQVEGAARKVNVDEDYDDDGEDEKKAVLSGSMGGSGQASPRGMSSVTGQPKAESISA
ncbi:hypothetical protein EPUS_02662 [Endocarpon pusillum Z07020]|uniref:Uncharacterized protein n=1 Tax=Endocarpon pusillum (strain Z07020 / HMAS-L-300199) TaxID=1263415 RepID=U1I132_ENDPU|nr:uncharacterized protein EPUS_02662 [Endocarpon pusillum Z07020]ERF76950.1 hypothetical protein EPUS_02662 [Endocarpon pusillum Z07020]